MPPNREGLLATAALTGNIDQMRSLLENDKEFPSEEVIQMLLETSAKNSHLDILSLLLAECPSVPLNEDIVRAAVNTGSIPIFKVLLARDPSIINMAFDRRGSPLIVACMGRQTAEYLRFLLEAGADPNQDPDAAAFPLALVAALYADPSAIDLLLQHGARLQQSGALAAAARRGNEPMIRRLLERGARPDLDAAAIGSGEPPLHVAVRAGHVGAARILLSASAAASDAVDATSATAMELAGQMHRQGKDMSEIMQVLQVERTSDPLSHRIQYD